MIRLSLLGTVEVDGSMEGGGGLPSHTRRLALLAYLTLRRPRGFVRRDTLLPLFWADLDQQRARKALRQAVYVLRKELSPEVVESRGGDEVLVSSEHLWCDAVAFEEALDAGRPVEALELYRGHLLPGFHISGAPDFTDWLERERYRLRSRAVEAARDLALDATKTGDLPAAVAWAERWLSLAPDDEQAAQQATLLLAQAGDRTGALRLYSQFKERLEEEYDLPPSPALDELAQAVRDGTLGTSSSAQPTPLGNGGGAAADGSQPGAPLRKTPSPRWRTRAVVTVGALVALSGALWVARDPSGQSQRPDDPTDVLAVLPFRVQGDPAIGYLDEGMVDLLSTSLNGAGPFRTVDPATLMAAVGGAATELTPSAGSSVAQRLGARFFVLGEVVEAAGSIRVTARLYDLDARVQAEAHGTAEEEAQVFQLVDLVARELLASRYGSPDLRLRGVAARTTGSLPALKAYLAAERALRADRPGEALAESRRAVTLDPAFALAHYRVSTAAAWMNQPRIALESARDAAASSEGLGPRDRLLLRAHLDQQERRFESAIDGYLAVVSEQPDHMEAWFKLGEVLFHANPIMGRDILEADEAFARTIELDPQHVHAAVHRARLAAIRRDVALFDSMAAVVRAVGAGTDADLEMMALRAALRPETEGAVVDAFTRVRPAAELNGAIWSRATFAGDLAGAARLARIALGAVNSLEWRAVLHVRLAYLALAQGRWEEGWSQLTQAEALDPSLGLEEKGLVVGMPFFPASPVELEEVRQKLVDWSPEDPPTLVAARATRGGLREHLRLYLLGIVQAQSGDPASAWATADALSRLPDPEWPENLVARWTRGVRAFALHAQGRDEEARAMLSGEGEGGGAWGFGGPPMMTESAERYLWAQLEARGGDGATAATAFDSFAYRRVYHLPFIAPAMLEKGRLAARTGRITDARVNYEGFIEVWRESEGSLRRVRDQAEAELSRLANASGGGT